MPIFNTKFLLTQDQDEEKLKKRYINLQMYQAKASDIKSFKEEKFQTQFLKDIFEDCLGYTLDTTNPTNFNLEREKKNETDGKKADGAILINGEVRCVIELKDQTTQHLDKTPSNRELSPVDQAFRYFISHENAKYVVVSNFNELRFYIGNKTTFEKFDLFTASFDEFKRLHLLLSFESISTDLPLKLKEKFATHEREISNKFYKDFSTFRLTLFKNICKNNTSVDKNRLLSLTQKLCDRFVFILFAEDRGLLRLRTIAEIKDKFQNQVTELSFYDFYKIYFKAIDEGSERLDIKRYNGGLFATDTELDGLKIDDSVLEAQFLSDYDFLSDIGVNILGHIFESSLNDLEELNAQINGDEFDAKQSKRKKDGIFYTPEFITEFIVENSLGALCKAKKDELGLDLNELLAPKNPKKLTKAESEIKDKIYAYREWLLSLKILDPACGSGAFLNQALEFLISEHGALDTYRKVYEGEGLGLYDIESTILENNLYGVDINADAVEIARLSLWLRTAAKGRVLTDLSKNLVAANSLLEFPFDFKFDVVIGNPPYVRQEAIKEQKPALQKYKAYSGTADLFVYFYELGITHLKENGLLGFICSNKFFRASYGKNLRKFILENTQITHIIDFTGVRVFEDASVDSAITIFKKIRADENSKFNFLASSTINLKMQKFIQIPQSTLTETNFTFLDNSKFELKSKIEKVARPLKDWGVNIYRGILTGLNEAFIVDSDTRDKILSTCIGDEREQTQKLIRPILRGRDIKRYDYEWAGLWLINIHNGYGTKPRINIDNFPKLKLYLDKFEPKLSNRSDKGATPYNLRNCAYLEEFEKEKILCARMVQSPKFAYDANNNIPDNTAYCITGENLKFLLAFLNSTAVYKIFNFFYAGGGLEGEIKINRLEILPIPQITPQNENLANEIINLVDEILKANEKIKLYEKHMPTLTLDEKLEAKENIDALNDKIKASDEKIDKLVFELYELTSDEIALITGGGEIDGITKIYIYILQRGENEPIRALLQSAA
ncbi:Eco57I restriction-modification methylase domain-containing protein [Campylobacter concisus]|uniref:Eco57I restriction-modification methylase domain-containing protein n=1 Tax=Campylobacter concisus TaxID=199 RepID=UPI0011E667D8|nr:N-6 DNA methylase [Campylobacter concisus]